jgi:RNA recognition motif-containing protein
MNKSTGKPKGTAFVEFADGAAAQKAVAACEARRASAGPGVSLKGNDLEIDAALVQDKARALAQEQSGFMGSTKDKRNLYLVRPRALHAHASFGLHCTCHRAAAVTVFDRLASRVLPIAKSSSSIVCVWHCRARRA